MHFIILLDYGLSVDNHRRSFDAQCDGLLDSQRHRLGRGAIPYCSLLLHRCHSARYLHLLHVVIISPLDDISPSNPCPLHCMPCISAPAPCMTLLAGTFLPPCHSSPLSPGLCLNVGILPNHTELKPYSPLQLFECQNSGLDSNEAFTYLNRSQILATGWPKGGCLDAIDQRVASVCLAPPCAVVRDSCNVTHPRPSQRWGLSPARNGTTYHVTNLASQKCLSAMRAGPHSPIQLVDCASTQSALLEWILLPQGHLMLASTAHHPTCCDAEYVAPASYGHFRGQVGQGT